MTPITFVGFDQPEPDIRLRRVDENVFEVIKPFRYQDRDLGVITAPNPARPLLTDLASVPWFTAWFTPVLGRHVPASILHDALIHPENEPTYVTSTGRSISRDEADRVYLDAMTSMGTPLVRRRVMWSASSIDSSKKRHPIRTWAWHLLLVILSIAVAADVLDLVDWSWPWRSIPERSFFIEWLIGMGVVAAVMAILAFVLLPWRYLRAALTQAIVFGLVFLPVLVMLPIWAVLSFLPQRFRRPGPTILP